MDSSQASATQPMPHQQQHSNLIRTDQVQKLPHLNDQQKVQHTQLVRNLWEMLNNRDPQTSEYQNAHMKLTQLSQNLMKGVRAYQQTRQQHALQQQQAQAAAGQGQRSQSANPQTFAQLLPQIQAKVNALQFFLPPNISKEQVQTWLPEARLRYGIALQKQEVGRARITELRQHFGQRQGAGNMSPEEVQEFKSRQLAAEKLYREGTDFLNKFKEQQENFKQQQVNRTGVQNPVPSPNPEQAAAAPANENRPNVPIQPGQGPTPAPHTINSAVHAARNQVGQSMSPATSQPSQPATTQPQVPAVPAGLPQQPHSQAQLPQGNPRTQAPFTQAPNIDGTSAPVQPVNPQGVPRPLSHQAAMAQAAQNYTTTGNSNTTNTNTNNSMTPHNMNQAVANPHAHPQGYIPNRASDNSTRNINMAIPKSLNVPPPEPVSMAPARPTLSGGPSHGAMGMMGQPAIQKHPGYVLEGEGQRVLSKKMLDGLVRQVTGGGEGEGLTPDAEEVDHPPPFTLTQPLHMS